MKTTLKTLIALTVFLTALTAVIASPNKMFSVVNNTSFQVGTVIVTTNDGTQTKINVPGPGVYSTDIPGGVVGAIINGQSIPKSGQTVDVKLATGFVVQVTMNGNQIVVTDQTISDGLHGGKKK